MEDCIFNPIDFNNLYWNVGNSATQVYSSAAGSYVPLSNANYQAWLANGNTPIKIAVEQDLFDVLSGLGLPLPAGGTTSDVRRNVMFDTVPQAVRSWAFDIENRFRVSQGQTALSPAQFKAYVKGLPGM